MQLTSLMGTILYRGTYRLSTRKNIMTTPRKMQEVIDDLKGNPYYDKYAQKIAKIQNTSPEEFKSRVEGLAEKKTKKIEATKGPQFSQLLKPKKKLDSQIQSKEMSLDKVMKVELIKDKSPDEIKAIWEEYHVQKDCIAATIPSGDYDKLEERSSKYPTFLFPLPRSQGYEFIMCQFESNSVHFTPLLYFQVHKENAPECLTMTHFKDFKDSKGIVLMRGEFDKNIITAKEAQCLANELQMYYVQHDEEKRKLMEVFTHKSDSFDHMDLVKQISNISLS